MLKRRRMLMGMEDFANGHEYVDLGLPSGTMWSTEVLYGYCWGETTSRQAYGTQVNNHVYGGDNGTKYNSTDNLTELEPSDDAASIVFGGAWVTPSREQFQELLDYTTAVSNPSSYYVDLTSTINGATLRVTYGPVYDFWTRNSYILNPAPNVEVTLAYDADILNRNISTRSRDYVLNVLPCIIKPGFEEITFSDNGNTVNYGSDGVYYYPKIDGEYIYGTVNDITVYNNPDNYVSVYSSSSTGRLYLYVYRPVNTGNTEITRSYIIDYKGKARGILTYHQGFLEYSQVDTTCRLLLHFENDYVDSVSNTALTAASSGVSFGIGKIGSRCLILSGDNTNTSSYLTKSNFITTSGSTKFTIDFWVTIGNKNLNDNGIFNLYYDSSDHFGLNAINASDSQKTTIKMVHGAYQYTVTTLNRNTWYHIAVVYDYSASPERIRIFINGHKTYTSDRWIYSYTYALRIGKSSFMNRGIYGNFDEFHVSDRALWTDDFTPPVTPWIVG